MQLDGSGRLGYVFSDENPRLLRIEFWALTGREINVSIAAESAKDSGIAQAKGHATSFALSLTVEGSEWKRHVELRRERDLERRWDKLRQAMLATR